MCIDDLAETKGYPSDLRSIKRFDHGVDSKSALWFLILKRGNEGSLLAAGILLDFVRTQQNSPFGASGGLTDPFSANEAHT